MTELARTILIVDDDDFTREMYVDVFKNSGFRVIEAHDGMEGMDLAMREVPDAIFTGIVMPRMDGFTMVENLRKQVSTASIPTFVSSHLGRQEDKMRAENMGIRAFIVRDLTPPNEVVQIVSQAFTGGREYILDFNAFDHDASKLSDELKLNNFQCMECNQKMLLKLRQDPGNKEWYQSKLVCPACGWQLP